tara:strand:+ start:224 stop:694 length:471 start_codon:yes stop_codon:yes gene_type:complete
MKEKAELKLNPKKNLNLNSNFWFWSMFAGVFFGIGYSITKNLYLSTIHTKPNFNPIQASKKLPNHRNPLSHGSNNKTNLISKDHPAKNKPMNKIIYLPAYKDSNIKLEINYSQIENLKNQAVFKTKQDFFAKETVKSLINSLKNTKTTKSSKVKAD